MTPIKYISPEEFREEGYLQEVNRRFLHPLGLAIEMVMNPSENPYAIVTVYDLAFLTAFLPEQPEDAPETIESAQRKNVLERVERAIENSNRAIFSGVWDDRDDPEGVNFAFKDFPGNDMLPAKSAEQQFEEATARQVHISELWRDRRRARVEALGYFVQPIADSETELGSDIVRLLATALAAEMRSVIPVKAESESWYKAARGILDKLAHLISREDYNPQAPSAEEIHVLDLVLGGPSFSGANTRVEAANMLVDERNFYKGLFDTASTFLSRIASGDIPPGMNPQEAADEMLANLAAELGG
jgi:hypothetical protein